MKRSDKQLLDSLQDLTKDYGTGWVLRDSTNGRGMRLHETTYNEGVPDVRGAINKYLDKFLENGYTDTFRMFNTEPENYTWWSYRMNSREKNVGWRIDYFCVNNAFKKKVKSADILETVMGSDHCPIQVVLK